MTKLIIFQFGIGDAAECEQCPQPGETTAGMGSAFMGDCSTENSNVFALKNETL